MLEETIIGTYQVGSLVNLEVDLIARYLERLLQGDAAANGQQKKGIDIAFLAENGYMK